jgi:hypothetical protein
MGNSTGITMLRREYMDSFLEGKLELDPSAIVEAQSKWWHWFIRLII